MGGLMLVFSLFFVVGAVVTGIRYVSPSSYLRAVIGWGLMASLLIATGVGLWYLKKWAAVAFSVLTAVCASVVFLQAFRGLTRPIPGRADWLGFPFALILLIPSGITVKVWRSLGRAHNVDPALLGAILIRESHMRWGNEIAGAGVGVGPFQLTVTSNSGVTAAQANDLSWAANYAANMLDSNMDWFIANRPT